MWADRDWLPDMWTATGSTSEPDNDDNDNNDDENDDSASSDSHSDGPDDNRAAFVPRAFYSSTLEEEQARLQRHIGRYHRALRRGEKYHSRFQASGERAFEYFIKSSKATDLSNKLMKEIRRELEKRASPEVRDDEATMLALVGVDPRLFVFCSDSLRSNEHVVLAALTEKSPGNFGAAGRGLRQSRRFALQAVERSGKALKFASFRLRNDRKVVRRAIKKDGTALRYAGGALRDSRRVVNKALKQNGMALRHASRRLRNKSRIVLRAVQQSGMALQFANENLRSQEALAIAAVKENGLALQFVSGSLGGDRNMTLAAVAQRGQALQFASAHLQGDKEVVLRAISSFPGALEHASRDLKADAEVVIAALRQQAKTPPAIDMPDVLSWASDELRSTPEVILEAVRLQNIGRKSLAWASPDLRKDQEFLLEAFRAAGSAPNMISILTQADESLRHPFSYYTGAIFSKLASRGEAGPILTISLAPLGSGSGSGSESSGAPELGVCPYAITSCEVTLLSGTSFSCSLSYVIDDVFPKPDSVPLHPAAPAMEGQVRDGDAGSSSGSESEDGNGDSVEESSDDSEEGDAARDLRHGVRDLRRRIRRLEQQRLQMRPPRWQPPPPPPPSLPPPPQYQLPLTRRIGLASSVGELSHVVRFELEKHIEARPLPERVSIIFRKADGNSVAVTPWDWNRPLTDFL